MRLRDDVQSPGVILLETPLACAHLVRAYRVDRHEDLASGLSVYPALHGASR